MVRAAETAAKAEGSKSAGSDSIVPDNGDVGKRRGWGEVVRGLGAARGRQPGNCSVTADRPGGWQRPCFSCWVLLAISRLVSVCGTRQAR